MGKSNTLFNDDFKALAKERGFRKKNTTFIRVINDMVQIFSLKCMYGHYCSLEFGANPLCLSQEAHIPLTYNCDFNLEDIPFGNYGDRYTDDKFFSYSDEKSFLKAQKYLYDGLKEVVIPYFDDVSRSSNYIKGRMKYHCEFYLRRYPKDKYYVQNMQIDFFGPLEESAVSALKSHNYVMAKLFIDRAVSVYNALPHNDWWYRWKKDEACNWIHKMKDLTDNHEYDKIDELLLGYERDYLEYLRVFFKLKNPIQPIITD